MTAKKELRVSAIQHGTVIDHIPANKLFKVISILKLDRCKNLITFGTNLGSNRFGKKAIVKVADKFFDEKDLNKIALVAPEARFNVIKDYDVVEKREVELPNEIVGIAKCFNPKCITNTEAMATKFSLVVSKEIALKCHYCEKITTKEHLVIL
ncbi:aspartate carbamoyltransferase regulatory subunit [Plebeiibacterium sediminum]|uniref:Aspartate carbamoyltransferase regulatory chain n=1 Tax=Plebeiibacterium sediminum TaxID=2992112 RepID=A0AAE3M160_9BACT|nr:aspartate carbamoyltransferase regulatory subunit [Plebeiobacterium sediminum]MCW3785209.1 aspartate carbamoyltransferase regulatory subunit [Plebeiobacterium sediminum]